MNSIAKHLRSLALALSVTLLAAASCSSFAGTSFAVRVPVAGLVAGTDDSDGDDDEWNLELRFDGIPNPLTVVAGTPVVAPMVLVNRDRKALMVGAVEFRGAGPFVYAQGHECDGVTLAPGGSCTTSLEFTYNRVGGGISNMTARVLDQNGDTVAEARHGVEGTCAGVC